MVILLGIVGTVGLSPDEGCVASDGNVVVVVVVVGVVVVVVVAAVAGIIALQFSSISLTSNGVVVEISRLTSIAATAPK